MSSIYITFILGDIKELEEESSLDVGLFENFVWKRVNEIIPAGIIDTDTFTKNSQRRYGMHIDIKKSINENILDKIKKSLEKYIDVISINIEE